MQILQENSIYSLILRVVGKTKTVCAVHFLKYPLLMNTSDFQVE